MLYYIVAFFQVVFCIALVGLILLHSGKGGGLSSSLGVGMGGTFSGTTIMEKNLTRLTLIVVGLFLLTNITLFFMGERCQPGASRRLARSLRGSQHSANYPRASP